MLYEFTRIIREPLLTMNLSLQERRRRLRELTKTYPGLVLASALAIGGDRKNAGAERPISPMRSQGGRREANVLQIATPSDPVPVDHPTRPSGTPRERRGRRESREETSQLYLW